jgi:hypothetical protein
VGYVRTPQLTRGVNSRAGEPRVVRISMRSRGAISTRTGFGFTSLATSHTAGKREPRFLEDVMPSLRGMSPRSRSSISGGGWVAPRGRGCNRRRKIRGRRKWRHVPGHARNDAQVCVEDRDGAELHRCLPSGRRSARARRSNRENGAVCVPNHSLRDAPDQGPGKTLASVGPDDDQVIAAGPRAIDDRGPRRPWNGSS